MPSTTPNGSPDGLCGAPLASGKTCRKKAGAGTNHPDEGLCWLHTTEGSDVPLCGRIRRKNKKPCTQSAGKGTAHPGVGYCDLHDGGATKKTVTGLNSRDPEVAEFHKHRRLAARIKEIAESAGVLELIQEVASCRAILEDLVERYDEGLDAPKTDRSGKTYYQVPDATTITQVAERIGVLVEKAQRAKSATQLTLADFNRLLSRMGEEVVAAVQAVGLEAQTADQLLDDIQSRWSGVSADTSGDVDEEGSVKA